MKKIFNNKNDNFLIICDDKKNKIKASLFEVECFLDKTINLCEAFKIFKILKKKKN